MLRNKKVQLKLILDSKRTGVEHEYHQILSNLGVIIAIVSFILGKKKDMQTLSYFPRLLIPPSVIRPIHLL